MRFNMARFDDLTETMGPGRRACLWVRGCPFHCEGCPTPEYRARERSSWRGVDEIINLLAKSVSEHRISGVSFSGGEPFAQAKSLILVAQAAHRLGLSVLSWSSYTIEELRDQKAPPGAAGLLAELDVLIDGRCKQKNGPLLPLRDSAHQKIHLLTNRYQESDFS